MSTEYLTYIFICFPGVGKNWFASHYGYEYKSFHIYNLDISSQKYVDEIDKLIEKKEGINPNFPKNYSERVFNFIKHKSERNRIIFIGFEPSLIKSMDNSLKIQKFFLVYPDLNTKKIFIDRKFKSQHYYEDLRQNFEVKINQFKGIGLINNDIKIEKHFVLKEQEFLSDIIIRNI